MTTSELNQIEARGITPEQVQSQLDSFVTGFPYLKLHGSATIGNGIKRLTPEEEDRALDRWKQYLAEPGASVTKFVPASGAASRMFKALFNFVNSGEAEPAEGSDVANLIANIDKVPFRKELNDTLQKLHGDDLEKMLADKRYHDIIAAIINPEGMNYGGLPKGLLTFHRYTSDTDTRTALEEQLVEGAQSAATGKDVCLHFTVSANHRKLFEQKLAEVVPALEEKLGVKYHISLSEQKPSTDTIAVDLQNVPVRDKDGNFIFRPGGHGALIGNLADIDSQVVFIKNIDNVVPDSRREPTLRYKQVLAGELILMHDRIAEYLRILNSGVPTSTDLQQMLRFLEDELSTHADRPMAGIELINYLKGKFNRPLRVCGMVRNEGEPGGGPFLAYNPDGTYSPQILESHQIDPANAGYSAMLGRATHFNPVDLVCYIKDDAGRNYPLADYVDKATGFISEKSVQGTTVRALELPGLWNGAMADWNTLFVEVPAETFNPVKTVNDLLRPAHQN